MSIFVFAFRKKRLFSFFTLFCLFLLQTGCWWLTKTQAKSENPMSSKRSKSIGLVLPLSGSFGAFGAECRAAFEFAREDEPQASGIKILYEDSMSTPQGAAQATNKLINSKVQVIFGEITSQNSLALAAIAEKKHIPVINPGATHVSLTDHQNVLRVCFDDEFQGQAVGGYLRRLKSEKLGLLINNDSEYSTGLAEKIGETYEKLGGKVVTKIFYQETDLKHTSFIRKLERSGADYVAAPGAYQRIGLILRQMRDLKFSLPVMGTDSWHQDKLPQLSGGATSLGFLLSTHFSSDEKGEEIQNFVSRFQDQHQITPGQIGAICYDAGRLALSRLNEYSGDLKDQKTIEQVMTRSDEFCGLIGCFHFDKKRNPIKPVYIIQTTETGFQFKDKIFPHEMEIWANHSEKE